MFVVKQATVHDGQGNVREECDIVVDDGKIVQIGKDLSAPMCIDARGKHVFPGFIDCCTQWGLLNENINDHDGAEKSSPITPELNTKFGFHVENVDYQKLCEYGITSLGVAPLNHNVFAGSMSVFKAHSNNKAPILVREHVAQKGSVCQTIKQTYKTKGIAPMTRMGVFSLLRDTLWKAQAYQIENGYDFKYESLLPVLRKEMPLFMVANTSSEIHDLLKATEEFPVALTIVNAYGASNCLDQIKMRNVSLVLGNQTTGTEEYYQMNKSDLQAIFQNDIPVALTASNDSLMDYGRETLLWNTTYLKKANIPSEEILKTITSTPAKLLGVDDVCGSIEVGKDADFSIWTDNPIETFVARCTQCFIQGNVVFEMEESVCL